MSTFRGRQEVTIAAPLEEVWTYGMDLSKIPEYNPRVAKVELDGGDSQHAAGVSYQCHLVGGPHRCTEEDVEIVPMACIVTRPAFDTLGIGTLLRDYTVFAIGDQCVYTITHPDPRTSNGSSILTRPSAGRL